MGAEGCAGAGAAAQRLYYEYASHQPILDYHNHLSPKDIADDRQFTNLTEAWLEGDHYKWRAMRINGEDEKYCTGNASAREKFEAWARTVPATLRNPLYHWTHLELKNYFGINQLLNPSSSKPIYDECSSLLMQKDFSIQNLLRKMKVRALCTTDDPADSLEYHQQFSKQNAGFKMLPTFRPDKVYDFQAPATYNIYIDGLSALTGISITHFADLIQALKKRIEFFHSVGGRISDHGLEYLFFDQEAPASGESLFIKIRKGATLTDREQSLLRCSTLLELGKLYHAQGWAQQFHLGAMRNNNSRKMQELGANTGFDSIGDFSQARHLASFLNHLDESSQLSKTILYNLNPADNEVFATMAGNFSDGSVPGKIQFGSGWWFLDQKDGMQKQINALSNMGLLSRFIGMTTDSRSFLSFPRHEYFRRVLCNLIGEEMENGELPNDFNLLGEMVKDICFRNAERYFGF